MRGRDAQPLWPALQRSTMHEAGIHEHVLESTGMRDAALERTWSTRTAPWTDMPAGCKWLGVIEGASHADLGCNDFGRGTQAIALRMILDYLDALRDGQCTAPVYTREIALRRK